MEYRHISVMLKEVIGILDPKPGQRFIDCTLGGAGYTLALSDAVGEKGKVLAIDMDPMAIENAKRIIENPAKGGKYKNIILENDNFKNLSQIVRRHFPSEQAAGFDGIVFDLGLSGAQLEDRDRGFSFNQDAPLDMSFGGGDETEKIVNEGSLDHLERIIRDYGEERFAKYIARKIVEFRSGAKILTTGRLVEAIKSAIPKRYQQGHIHPATKTFQALRIATNRELENIEEALPQALELLRTGGRIAVVSFHSLEDRIVKQYFKKENIDCVCPPQAPACVCEHKAKLKIITKKIIEPSDEEVRNNPKSRSAKLRVAEKIQK